VVDTHTISTFNASQGVHDIGFGRRVRTATASRHNRTQPASWRSTQASPSFHWTRASMAFEPASKKSKSTTNNRVALLIPAPDDAGEGKMGGQFEKIHPIPIHRQGLRSLAPGAIPASTILGSLPISVRWTPGSPETLHRTPLCSPTTRPPLFIRLFGGITTS
jgi:hypothetical protein